MHLYVMNGHEEGRWVAFEGDAVLVGRSESAGSAERDGERNGVVFAHDRELSGTHARFVRDGGTWQIENLGRSGTFVNEASVSQLCGVVSGDVIRMGRTLLLVCETEHVIPAMRVATATFA